MIFFHSLKKRLLTFIKYFLEKKSSLSHHVTKDKKREKKIVPPPLSNDPIPHHQKNNSLKIKKISPSNLENQLNFSFSCHLRNKPLS
jgi:hypothetical protein